MLLLLLVVMTMVVTMMMMIPVKMMPLAVVVMLLLLVMTITLTIIVIRAVALQHTTTDAGIARTVEIECGSMFLRYVDAKRASPNELLVSNSSAFNHRHSLQLSSHGWICGVRIEAPWRYGGSRRWPALGPQIVKRSPPPPPPKCETLHDPVPSLRLVLKLKDDHSSRIMQLYACLFGTSSRCVVSMELRLASAVDATPVPHLL
jgi:hypothetical protein